MITFRKSKGTITWYAILGAWCIDKTICDNIFGEDEYENGIRVQFNLENFIVHKDYQKSIKYYDVGIVKLDNPVMLGYNLNTICLPEVGVMANNV